MDSASPNTDRCALCGRESDSLDRYCPACGRRKIALQVELIDHDLACIQCNYILRGLRTDSQCPECGTLITRTLRGDYLIHSSPNFVRRIHIGVRLLASALLASGMLIISAILAAFTDFDRSSSAPAIWQSLIILICAVNFAGWWLLTSPDPDRLSRDRLRFSTRCIVIASSASQLIAISLTMLVSTGVISDPDSDDSWLTILGSIVTIVAMVSWPVRIIFGLYHLRGLCRRFPDAPRAKLCRALALQVVCGIAISLFLGVIFGAIGNGDLAGAVASGTACLWVVFGLIWNGIYLALLGGIGDQARLVRLAQQAYQAPRNPQPPLP